MRSVSSALWRRVVAVSIRSVKASDSEPVGWPSSIQRKRLEAERNDAKAAIVCSFGMLLDLKDLGTGTHATRLAEWAVLVARELGVPSAELRDIEIASLLHDIGKIGVPDAVLNKPGSLTDSERSQVERHPEYGWAILRLLPGFERVNLLVLHHHERIDGSGYPAGLRGEEIPLGARIVSVVDAFDAMTSDRPYRRVLPLEEALRRLTAERGTQFDSRIVDLFCEIVVRDTRDHPLPSARSRPFDGGGIDGTGAIFELVRRGRGPGIHHPLREDPREG